MGSKLKLVVIAVLVISASVLGQDEIVNEHERTVNNGDNAEIPQDVEVTERTAGDAPVELIENTNVLEVRSGKYQVLHDGLEGDEPTNLEAVELGSSDGQNERQMIAPPGSTFPTTSEYGKN